MTMIFDSNNIDFQQMELQPKLSTNNNVSGGLETMIKIIIVLVITIFIAAVIILIVLYINDSIAKTFEGVNEIVNKTRRIVREVRKIPQEATTSVMSTMSKMVFYPSMYSLISMLGNMSSTLYRSYRLFFS